MDYGNIRPVLEYISRNIAKIETNTGGSCCIASTSAGTGSVPEGFSSIYIVQTSSGGTVGITMTDGTIFTLDGQGQTFVLDVSPNKLPAFQIVSGAGGTWQWFGVK